MRTVLTLVVALCGVACSPGLGPRAPVAEVPIGTANATTTTTTSSSSSSDVADTSDGKASSGMVAAKIEDTDSKKPAEKAAKKPAAKKRTHKR